jgi:hypothetical protein
LRCARHIRVTDERCPFCEHAAFARPCAALSLCAALTLAACARDNPISTPIAAAPARVLTVPDVPVVDVPVVDARALDDASSSDDVASAADVAPRSFVSRRAPRQRAIVVRPEREDVPLYGVSPKAWNNE